MEMLLRLLSNWKLVAAVSGGTAALATALLGFGLHTLVMRSTTAQHMIDLQAIEQRKNAECLSQQKKIQEASHDYQSHLAAVNRRLAADQLRANTCIVPTAGSASRSDAATGNTRLPAAYGIPAGTLYDFAAAAERTGSQLDYCQNFIRQVWQQRQPE